MVKETFHKAQNLINELHSNNHIDNMKMAIPNAKPTAHSSVLHTYQNSQADPSW